ncbi:MAG: hypothetical protein NDJ89_03595, partial [Oligoflexia bacterium]|nr:hypothetical protein [Oligoflexia bacterium]
RPDSPMETNAVSPLAEPAAMPRETPPLPSLPPLNSQDSRKFRMLEEILVSRNDNDPRLDRELKGLSPELKAALRAKYQQLPAEDRNGRGTIAFLVGREAAQPEDFEFLGRILSEPACLSLADCTREPPAVAAEELHLEGTTEVTLAYPQLVALKWLETDRPLEGPAREAALRALESAKRSNNPIVSRKAAEIEKKLSRH